MVLWLWETLNRDGNMTKLQGPLGSANCPRPQMATSLPLSHPGERCPVSLRQKPAGKTGPTLREREEQGSQQQQTPKRAF